MRYIILVLLNLPIILLAFTNLLTKYKLRKISSQRFKMQMLIWSLLLIALIGSFPLYNTMVGRAPLDSHELSLFDIVQTTVIVLLFYTTNNQRQSLEQTERRLRDLHQELSILLSKNDSTSSGK